MRPVTWWVGGSGVFFAALFACVEGSQGGFEDTPLDGGPSPQSDAPPAPTCNPSREKFDVPGNQCDDDADGIVDNTVASCDTDLSVDGDAAQFSRALGFCRASDGQSAGILSAEFSNGWELETPPASEQHGVLTRFGDVIQPAEGAALGVLSTGWARTFNGPTGRFQFKGGEKMQLTTGAVPPDFPRQAAGCGDGGAPVFDVVSFRVKLKVPTNAQGLSFQVNFYSSEWPEFVCTRYNDGFVAMLTSQAVNAGRPSNVSFDANNNVLSVNNGFFERCTPNTETGCAGDPPVLKMATCSAGTSELSGTGFGQPQGRFCGSTSPIVTPGGSTGWLRTKAPVTPGETVSLEFILWDTGDQRYDSTILLDDFRWEAAPVPIITEPPR